MSKHMKNNQYNLQILHHEEVFASRELALQYLNDYYRPYSLDAEPLIVKYGDTLNPDVILAFGTSDAAPGSFYAIDMTKTNEDIERVEQGFEQDREEIDYIAERLSEIVKANGLDFDDNKIKDKITYKPDVSDNVIGSALTIAQAIDALSKYTQETFTERELHTEDTNSVRLIYSVNAEGKKTLKGEIKVSADGNTDNLSFNNNLIGLKSDGIFASAFLAFDEVRNELIFTTSGYKNGVFRDDAVVQHINLGVKPKITANNEEHTVKLTIAEDTATNTNVLSGDVQISTNEDNILEVKDNKLAVIGRAKNIKYGNTTVSEALATQGNKINELTTSVENASKSAHIVGDESDTFTSTVTTLSDGGAKITGNVRLGSSNSITVKNGGLEVNMSIDIDTATNKLIVNIGNQTIEKQLPGVELFQSAEYNDANEELIITFVTGKTLNIPIHGIIHTWETENNVNSPITLTKTVITGGVDKLSAALRLRSTDNLINVDNGNLFVSENAINSKVDNETLRATNAETQIRNDISSIGTAVGTNAEAITELDEAVTSVKDSIAAETTRATLAEQSNTNAINTLSNNVNRKIEKVEIVKNSSSDLQYILKVDDVDAGEINIPKDQFLKSVTYDPTNKEFTFTFETATGVSVTKIKIDDLVDTYIAGNGLTLNGNKFAVKINEDSESYLTVSEEGVKLLGVDAKLSEKANLNDVYTKSEIDNKGYITQHQDISGLASKSELKETDDKATQNADDISNLTSIVNDIKFVTTNSDAINLTMDKQTGSENRTLSANVKLKTIAGSENSNIIKVDENGLYATVSFNYDKALNKITFNDGNGDKTFELNNFGILQDAFYESSTKSIVLIVKKDDETTNRIEIPVFDLVNTWSVENKSTSPVILEKTSGETGDVLSADISILNNANNLLVKENGSLFADADSNKHIALWGVEQTSVQGVINILKERTDKIEGIEQDINDLKNDSQDIRIAMAGYQADLDNQKERISRNETSIENISLSQSQLESRFEELSSNVNRFDEKITEALNKATEAKTIVDQLNEKLGNIEDSENTVAERLEQLENAIANLIDFGEYNNGN